MLAFRLSFGKTTLFETWHEEKFHLLLQYIKDVSFPQELWLGSSITAATFSATGHRRTLKVLRRVVIQTEHFYSLKTKKREMGQCSLSLLFFFSRRRGHLNGSSHLNPLQWLDWDFLRYTACIRDITLYRIAVSSNASRTRWEELDLRVAANWRKPCMTGFPMNKMPSPNDIKFLSDHWAKCVVKGRDM